MKPEPSLLQVAKLTVPSQGLSRKPRIVMGPRVLKEKTRKQFNLAKDTELKTLVSKCTPRGARTGTPLGSTGRVWPRAQSAQWCLHYSYTFPGPLPGAENRTETL